METRELHIVILGLTITSSWGNGHATTYRGLVKGLARRGHRVLFLEYDRPWYAAHRDLPRPPFCETALYRDLPDLKHRWRRAIASADFVIMGSYVPDGVAIGEFVHQVANGPTAFYDIDTPVTLSALEAGTCAYLSADLLKEFSLYLSFTGGPTLEELEQRWGARNARPLYCAVDSEIYYPSETKHPLWDLGYLGTFSPDRQPMLDGLLSGPAREWVAGKFVVAGSLYPPELQFPENVDRIQHLAPSEHQEFYASQRFTLNVTRAAMVERGWSPSVRLFEAASCGTPIITDPWPGLETLFNPGSEIIVARTGRDVLHNLIELPEESRIAIGAAARARVLANHTSNHRAIELERLAVEAIDSSRRQVIA